MAVRQRMVEGIGLVSFQKRRGTKSVRINIQGHTVKVTLPHWVSYQEAEKFIKSRQKWILDNKLDRNVLAHGALIGKRYQLVVENIISEQPKTRILNNIIRIQLPERYEVEDEASQLVIEKACERALAKEAKELLTPRIHDLAYEHGFEYQSLHFKKLKRRWGSCDNKKHIVLNIFLTQLPWEYIDYVLLHELTHTEHLHHGADFWQKLQDTLPNAKQLRKDIQRFHPQLLPQ